MKYKLTFEVNDYDKQSNFLNKMMSRDKRKRSADKMGEGFANFLNENCEDISMSFKFCSSELLEDNDE